MTDAPLQNNIHVISPRWFYFRCLPFIYFYLFLNQVTRLSIKLLGGNLWDEEVCLKETGRKKIFFKSAPRGRCSSLSQKGKKKRREREKKKHTCDRFKSRFSEAVGVISGDFGKPPNGELSLKRSEATSLAEWEECVIVASSALPQLLRCALFLTGLCLLCSPGWSFGSPLGLFTVPIRSLNLVF